MATPRTANHRFWDQRAAVERGWLHPEPGGWGVISAGDAWVTVVCAGIGTYLIRLSFLSVAHKATELAPLVRTILRMIPPAALAALVTPGLLRPDDALDPVSAETLAGVLAGLVAWRTRSVIWPLVIGLPVALVLG